MRRKQVEKNLGADWLRRDRTGQGTEGKHTSNSLTREGRKVGLVRKKANGLRERAGIPWDHPEDGMGQIGTGPGAGLGKHRLASGSMLR
jgi:hypothetical protein